MAFTGRFRAAVNVQNDSGDTPLHKAAYTGREDIVNLLIEYSADTKVRPSGLTRRSPSAFASNFF
jgi:ankyrin repeat protein